MGLVNGALQIGRSALLAYQSALQVVGNNVSNAGSTNYTRQNARLSASVGVGLPEGFMPGGGVALSSLQRSVDSSLDDRLRVSTSGQSAASAQQESISRIESVLNELSDADLSTLLGEFFSSFSDLQNSLTDTGVRRMVLSAAESVIGEIKRQREDVLQMRDEMNTQIGSLADQVNRISGQIAALNVQITASESPGSGGANALRDQRDGLLGDLSKLIQIEVREQPDSSVNVYVGNDLMVSGGMSRGVTSTLETTNNEPRTVVRFADNQQPLTLQGGQIAGLVTARDADVMGHIDSLNSLVSAIINEVNKVHSSGQGLTGYSTITGAFDVDDANAVLSNAGLDLTPKNGSFILTVTNTHSSPVTSMPSTITVDLDGVGADDTLTTLAAKIDALDNVTAEVTSDNRLKITADDSFQVTFGDDTSGALAALGINVFFTGSNSQDLSVNPELMNNLDLLAAAQSSEPGDSRNAAAMAALGSTSLAGLDGQSILDFYNTIASGVAVRGAAMTATLDSTSAVVDSLTAQRESLSGVSLDEEAISLMQYQRAFQAAAQYTTTINSLMDEVLALVK